jgi:hypothetical protein
MKRHLGILLTFGFAVVATANEMRQVKVSTRVSSSGEATLVESNGDFQGVNASLSIRLDANGRIAAIAGVLEESEFTVPVADFKAATNFQFDKLSLISDCCVSGMAVTWQLPFGEAIQCVVDTPQGKRSELIHPTIYVTVDEGGRVRRARIFEC